MFGTDLLVLMKRIANTVSFDDIFDNLVPILAPFTRSKTCDLYLDIASDLQGCSRNIRMSHFFLLC